MPYKFPPNLQNFLPSKTLSVTSFINFTFAPNGAPYLPKFMCVEKFYSGLPPTTEDASQVANMAVPPESIIKALWELIRNKADTVKSIRHGDTVSQRRRWILMQNLLLCHTRGLRSTDRRHRSHGGVGRRYPQKRKVPHQRQSNARAKKMARQEQHQRRIQRKLRNSLISVRRTLTRPYSTTYPPQHGNFMM
jgi:hypothetical protein